MDSAASFGRTIGCRQAKSWRSMKVSYRVLGTFVSSIVFFFVQVGWAQELSLRGTVRDADGVVPDATVTAANGAAAPQLAITDSAGVYRFSNLAAGYYQLSFAKEGYDAVTRNLTLGPETGPVDVT